MIQLITFLLFTGLVGYISWVKTHKDDHESTTGYFLAGRSLPWIVVAGSLLLTNLSTEQLVGLNGGAFKNGMQVMAWEVWAAIAMVVMALVFLPRYLKGGVTTVSQFLQRRYDPVVGAIISVLLLLSLLTNLLPFVLYSGALFMERVFNVSEMFGGSKNAGLWLTVIALGVVGSLYAIFGGLKAVAVSDTINGIGLFVGGLMIPVLGLFALGDGSLSSGISTLTEVKPKMLNPVGPPDGDIPFATLFTGMILINVYYWCTNQAIVQRTFASRSLQQGQKGVLFAAALKLLGPFYLVLPGIIALHLFGLVNQNGTHLPVASVVDEDLAAVVQTVGEDGFSVIQGEAKLKEALDVSGLPQLPALDGMSKKVGEKEITVLRVLKKGDLVAQAEDGSPEVVEVEDPDAYLGYDKQDRSYGKLVKRIMPTWLLGFFAAVIFGAILSSFNSGLNSATTLFSIDLYKGFIHKTASDREMVKVGKIFGIVIAVGAILVAPMIASAGEGLFNLMKKLAALYNIPLLAITLVGIFAPRVPAIAAKVALLSGFTFYAVFGLWQNNHVFGVEMHWLHVAGLNFAIIVVLMFAIAAFAPRAEPYKQKYTEDVDIQPWKGAVPCGVVIVLLVTLMYLLLSRFG